MAKIALKFTYRTTVIEVSDRIAKDIKKHRGAFDKWLYDKNNDHGLWVIENGKKMAVVFDSSDFVNYLNEYVVMRDEPMTKIVQSDLWETPEGLPVLFF